MFIRIITLRGIRRAEHQAFSVKRRNVCRVLVAKLCRRSHLREINLNRKKICSRIRV
jgi:hypothetical protein